MPKKKKTLPKNFNELLEIGDIDALKKVYDQCEIDAYERYSKLTALSFSGVPDELVVWLVEEGANINIRDRYNSTPLHNQAKNWKGNIKLLIELGADIKAVDNYDNTPLHIAANYHRPKAVKELLEHGADINAENYRKYTPLASALESCENASIVRMAEIADILLKAGSSITTDMIKWVKSIGENFEFYRDSFNKDYLYETDVALSHLYECFSVTPIPKQQKHDGVSNITTTETDWSKQYEELWNYLVPGNGYAKTIQGEVIRIIGRVSYEILDNGRRNWDIDYNKMLNALIEYFTEGIPLEDEVSDEVNVLIKNIKDCIKDDENELERLSKIAVKWVINNPKPILMKKPHYIR